MSHKGYSIFKRPGRIGWYVAWHDGSKRRVKRASDSKSVANEIGRSLALKADRVRRGTATAGELQAEQSQREPVTLHTEAWEKALLKKKVTAKFAKMQRNRVDKALRYMGVDSLDQLNVERVQEALGKIADESSPNTANHYRTALTSFCRWCLKTDKMIGSPMPAVDRVKETGETFRRHAFAADELERLYKATETRKAKCPVNGKDRAMWYRLMANTGFRRAEAASLTPESFDLDNKEQPTVTVEAGYSKRRRRDSQPITREFAGVLRLWLMDKESDGRVFDFPKWSNVERVFKQDCKAAEISAPDGVRLGMHSLRRFYITHVVRGAGLAAGQDLARHSDPALTKKYADLTMDDYRKGLAALPKSPERPAEQKKTG